MFTRLIKKWKGFRAVSKAWNVFIYLNRQEADSEACRIVWKAVDELAEKYEAI